MGKLAGGAVFGAVACSAVPSGQQFGAGERVCAGSCWYVPVESTVTVPDMGEL